MICDSNLYNDIAEFDDLPQLAPEVEVLLEGWQVWELRLELGQLPLPVQKHLRLQLLELSGRLAAAPIRFLGNTGNIRWRDCGRCGGSGIVVST